MNKRYDFYELLWDSNYFNINCAKLTLYQTVHRDDKNEILNLLNENTFTVIQNKDNNSYNNLWIASYTNSFLADVNIQYEKKLNSNISLLNYTESNISILNNLEPCENLMRIAKSNLIYSRFFNDPFLDEIKKKNIYSYWVKNSFKKTNKFFVFEGSAYTCRGFILFNINNDVCTIELIAIDKNSQGKHLGKNLLNEMERFLFVRNIELIKVGTQSNNYLANLFYIKRGFNFSNVSSIYHTWKKGD